MFIQKGSTAKRILRAALVAYIFLLISAAVFARKTQTDSYSLVPFWKYSIIAEGGKKGNQLLWETILNILMTVPLGMMLPPLLKCRKFLKTVLFGLGLSVCIEILQLLFHCGFFEIDDFIHNALGSFIGYCLYKLLSAGKTRISGRKSACIY